MKNKCIRNMLLIFINSITLTRLVGAFIIPFIYIKHGISITSFIILCLFATDAVDGFLARKLKLSTMFGSAADALCDKLLNFVAFVLLGLTYNILFIPFGLELLIMFINYLIYRNGGNVQTSKTGRFKTIISDIFVVLCFVIMSLPTLKINIPFIINHLDLFINIFTLIIIIFDLTAIIDYFKKFLLVKHDEEYTHVKYQNRKRKTLKEVINDLFDTDYYIKHKNEPILKQFYK